MHVILYYNFVKVENPSELRSAQETFCHERKLKGRILIAEEGINGTLSGQEEDIKAYMDYMHAHAAFKNTEFKIDKTPEHTFHKLHVRVKPEIVHFGLPEVDATSQADNYIEPDEFRQILREQPEDAVIVDARSNYEHRIGRFKGAITFDIDNFRELPQQLEELKKLRGKKIYTYCTGGIKCEKVSAWLKREGFEQVYQLHGGIIRYAHETGGENFEGSCYVFDQRVAVPVNQVNPKVIGACKICAEPTEQMINCANAACNDHFLICDKCVAKYEGCCSTSCMEAPKRREYDGRGYYLRGVNSKSYINVTTPK